MSENFKSSVDKSRNPHFDLDDDLRDILGTPCFTVAWIADSLRGTTLYKCDEKAEDEQAVALYWMLCHYLKHGKDWLEHASKEIAEMRAKLKSQPTQ